MAPILVERAAKVPEQVDCRRLEGDCATSTTVAAGAPHPPHRPLAAAHSGNDLENGRPVASHTLFGGQVSSLKDPTFSWFYLIG